MTKFLINIRHALISLLAGKMVVALNVTIDHRS